MSAHTAHAHLHFGGHVLPMGGVGALLFLFLWRDPTLNLSPASLQSPTPCLPRTPLHRSSPPTLLVLTRALRSPRSNNMSEDGTLPIVPWRSSMNLCTTPAGALASRCIYRYYCDKDVTRLPAPTWIPYSWLSFTRQRSTRGDKQVALSLPDVLPKPLRLLYSSN